MRKCRGQPIECPKCREYAAREFYRDKVRIIQCESTNVRPRCKYYKEFIPMDERLKFIKTEYFDPRFCECGSDQVYVDHTRQGNNCIKQERVCKDCGEKFNAIIIRTEEMKTPISA